MESPDPRVADSIEHFRMCSMIGRLKIEVETGLKFRQSTLVVAKRFYPITARTKREGLEQMLDLYEERYGKRYGVRSNG